MNIDDEIMDIAQEECAEVIQAISKIRRFGIDTEYMDVTNRTHLETEVGDLMCMFDLMIEKGIISEAACLEASRRKRIKLQVWSNIK
jgi:hypothetical protein